MKPILCIARERHSVYAGSNQMQWVQCQGYHVSAPLRFVLLLWVVFLQLPRFHVACVVSFLVHFPLVYRYVSKGGEWFCKGHWVHLNRRVALYKSYLGYYYYYHDYHHCYYYCYCIIISVVAAAIERSVRYPSSRLCLPLLHSLYQLTSVALYEACLSYHTSWTLFL